MHAQHVICGLSISISERGEFEPERTDDEFLIKFLRSRFFKLENTYTLVRCSLRFKTHTRKTQTQ